MKEPLKFLICGCARNCSKYLVDVFENIKILMKHIEVVEIIISYDISEDNTLKKIQSLQNEMKNIKILINDESLTNQRTLNISNARNRIMDYISIKYNTTDCLIDYFIMMDLDDVCSTRINIETFMTVLDKYGNEHDCITFNNEVYYDYWALSFENYLYSCWHSNNPKQIINIMKNKLNDLLSKNNYINVTSAFNGFGIYKFKVFKNLRYEVHPHNDFIRSCIPSFEYIYSTYNIKFLINPNIYDCEHRMFHFKAIKTYNASCIIVRDNLFKKYIGHHVQ